MMTSSIHPPQYPAISPRPTPTVIAIASTSTPTAREMRAPAMTRLRRSRPRSSVPKGCAADGGRSLSSGAIRRGSNGAAARPATARTSRNVTMVAPIQAAGMRTSARSESATKLVPARGPATSVADARVEDSIQHVHGEVDDDVDHGQQKRAPHDRGVIEGNDALHAVEPQAGPGKDELHDEDPAQQGAHLQAHDRQHRDQRVAQAVPDVDVDRRDALGPRGAHVVV